MFFELSDTPVEGLWDGFINLGPSVVQLIWVFSLRNLSIVNTNTSSVSSVKSQLFIISVSISSSFMAFKISSLRCFTSSVCFIKVFLSDSSFTHFASS